MVREKKLFSSLKKGDDLAERMEKVSRPSVFVDFTYKETRMVNKCFADLRLKCLIAV